MICINKLNVLPFNNPVHNPVQWLVATIAELKILSKQTDHFMSTCLHAIQQNSHQAECQHKGAIQLWWYILTKKDIDDWKYTAKVIAVRWFQSTKMHAHITDSLQEESSSACRKSLYVQFCNQVRITWTIVTNCACQCGWLWKLMEDERNTYSLLWVNVS